MRERPRAWFDDNRADLAIDALKVLATMCRRSEQDYAELAANFRLIEREKNEWSQLYSKVLSENAELVRGDPSRAIVAEMRSQYTALTEEHINLQRMHTSMMQDRDSLHHQLDESQAQVRRLNEAKESRGPGW